MFTVRLAITTLALFCLCHISAAQSDQLPIWFHPLNAVDKVQPPPSTLTTMEDLPQERYTVLTDCSMCVQLELRRNYYTLDGNFYSTERFENIVSFFHNWMLLSSTLHQQYRNTPFEYRASYALFNSDQHVTLVLERINQFYRFEIDSLARDKEFFQKTALP